MHKNTLKTRKAPLEFSGFPEGFIGVTEKDQITHKPIRDFIDKLDEYLIDKGENISGIEYLYELYIHQNMTSKDMMDIVADLSHYENDRSLGKMLRETFGWKKVRNTKEVIESNASEVEILLASKVDRNFSNRNTHQPTYNKRDNRIEKTRKLFTYLGIIDNENDFNQEIINLREAYGANDVATAINHIISHYTGGIFCIQTRQINSLNMESLNSKNIDKLQKAWLDGWSELFYKNLSSSNSLQRLLFKSARDFSKSGKQGAQFIDTLITSKKSREIISPHFFVNRICDIGNHKTASLYNALVTLGIDEKQAEDITRKNVKRNRSTNHITICTEEKGRSEIESSKLPDDITSQMKILWIEDKAGIDQQKVKVILSLFRGVSFDELYKILQNESIRQELIHTFRTHKIRIINSKSIFNMLIKYTPQFVSKLEKISEEKK